MNRIVICGDSEDRELTKTLIHAFRKYGTVNDLSDVRSGEDSITGSFAGRCCGFRPYGESGAALFRGNLCVIGAGSQDFLHQPDITTDRIILNTENHDALSVLDGLPLPVVGCSMSGRDTVSLSCLDEDGVLVSLQRSVCTLSGEEIEPCEIKVIPQKPLRYFTLMAVCCALLLCDVPYENGYMF